MTTCITSVSSALLTICRTAGDATKKYGPKWKVRVQFNFSTGSTISCCCYTCIVQKCIEYIGETSTGDNVGLTALPLTLETSELKFPATGNSWVINKTIIYVSHQHKHR